MLNANGASPTDMDDFTPPGDDIVPAPRPVREEPPFDRYCDIVLTGGVASGVVYPWAIVELARHYRFRNIGGTSVGALAAALAAAAEYGRRTGFEQPFEALRRAPADLAHLVGEGKATRMLSLFQTNVHGKRLIWIWGQYYRGNADRKTASDEARRAPREGGFRRLLGLVLCAYSEPIWLGVLDGAVLAVFVSLVLVLMGLQLHHAVALAALLGAALPLPLAAVALVRALL